MKPIMYWLNYFTIFYFLLRKFKQKCPRMFKNLKNLKKLLKNFPIQKKNFIFGHFKNVQFSKNFRRVVKKIFVTDCSKKIFNFIIFVTIKNTFQNRDIFGKNGKKLSQKFGEHFCDHMCSHICMYCKIFCDWSWSG